MAGHYVVFANYDHFKQSGFAAGADDDRAIYGEVHGGATPEERLVPVIVVDSHREIPLMARWASSSVKIRRKKATFEIVFNKAVSQLIVKMDGVQGVASMKGADASVWQVEFANVKAGQYTSEVFADMHGLDAAGGDSACCTGRWIWRFAVKKINCCDCGVKLSKDEIALSKKLLDIDTEEFYCLSCMATYIGCDENDLKMKIAEFKEQGCALFL